MGIGAVGGLEPPLGTMPPLGIYRVSSQLLCKECCSLVGCYTLRRHRLAA